MATITTWAQCDACTKWRRVPQSLADSLGDNDAWTCDQNPNPSFASCSVEQELSDHEIDRQLDSNEETVTDIDHKARGKRPAVWQLVTENEYTHRARKVQDEDDIMICQCRMRTYGGKGCGPDCLNRLLNIECVPGYCPSCEECNNQMFSKRQYADIEKRRAGAKGFGLFAKSDLQAGQFIIQYLGEVLEEEEYVRRKVHYQASGQRHYYFMNVGNGEVIDACRKGALGRFINHSCDPNCETQKWVVEGELAIGLFATKFIAAGTELTFDYNFERYGDKPMKCLCGSEKCRGFVGGTQETTLSSKFEEVDDASEDPEPIMVTEAEADAALTAILDQNIGVGPNGWDARLQNRLAALARKHGVPLWEDVATIEDAGSDAESCGHLEAAVGLEAPLSLPKPVVKARRSAARGRQKVGNRSARQAAPKPGTADDQPDVAQPPHKRLKSTVEGDTSCSFSTASTTTALLLSSSAAAEQSPVSADVTATAPRDEAVPIAPADPPATTADAEDSQLLKATAPVLTETSAETATVTSHSSVLDATHSAKSRATLAAADVSPMSATNTAAPVARKPTRMVLSALSKELARGQKAARKRSEIDRRLDALVPAGKLRDATTATVVKVLRLFNLCDIGAAGYPPCSRPCTEHTTPTVGGWGGHRHSPSLRSPGRKQHHHGDGTPRGAATRPHRRPSSWDTEVQSAHTERPEVTARQRARMADLSLLLDVICNTTSPSAKQELVKCGLLRQLHSTLGRNVAPTYQVVLRKMLRAVEGLPLTADDVHLTRSAHGTFADILSLLAIHSDPEVRTKAVKLLQRYPVSACTHPIIRSGSSGGGPPAGPGSHSGRCSSVSSSSTGIPWSGAPPPLRARPAAPMEHANGSYWAAARPSIPHSGWPRGTMWKAPDVPKLGDKLTAQPTHQGFQSPLVPLQHQTDSGEQAKRLSPAAMGAMTSPGMPHLQQQPAFPGDQPASTASPVMNGGGGSTVRTTPSRWSPAADSKAEEQPSVPQPPPLHTARQHGDEALLPPGFGTAAGMTHRTPPPLPPPLASPDDAALHLAAGVPLGGFPPPSSLLPQAVDPSARQSPAGDAPVPSHVSDQEQYNLAAQPFVNESIEKPQQSRQQQQQQQQQDGDPPWSRDRPASPQLAPNFFDVDLRDAGGSTALLNMPQDWDSPHTDFRSYVSEFVRVRLGRLLQAAPPQRIGEADAQLLYAKVSGEILAKEQQAYRERDKAGAHKLIDRRKLEPKIKEFIRDSVRRLHAAQQT